MLKRANNFCGMELDGKGLEGIHFRKKEMKSSFPVKSVQRLSVWEGDSMNR